MNLEHPNITHCLETGYPWKDEQIGIDVDDPENDDYEDDSDEYFEDAAYDEKREREMGWID